MLVSFDSDFGNPAFYLRPKFSTGVQRRPSTVLSQPAICYSTALRFAPRVDQAHSVERK
jgi:hypothetical protein